MIEILLTSSLTVVSGVIVYIIGEVLQTIWLSPLQKYKEIKHDVAVALTYYARDYSNVIDTSDDEKGKLRVIEVSNKLRMVSCELTGYIETLSWIKIGIPPKADLKEAAECLMGLSNSLSTPHKCPEAADDYNKRNRKIAKKICSLMGMYGYKAKGQQDKKS